MIKTLQIYGSRREFSEINLVNDRCNANSEHLHRDKRHDMVWINNQTTVGKALCKDECEISKAGGGGIPLGDGDVERHR